MAEAKSIDSATEVREFEKGRVEVVTAGKTTVTRSTMQPGWRWSECVKPIAGTEIEINPGDAYSVPPGHDASVVGDEPWVGVDFSPAMADFAKPR